MNPGDDWFSELSDHGQTALSIKLRARLHVDSEAEPRIEVVESDDLGRVLILDGRITLTERDHRIYHEMLVHPALYDHPNPRRVVIVGGEDGGSLSEVNKHREVEQAVQIGVDERIARCCEKYFPALATLDSRAQRLSVDPRSWLEHEEPGSVDVVLIDAPRSSDHASELYDSVYRALDVQGVLVQASGSPLTDAERRIKPTHDTLRRHGFLDILTLQFPQSAYPSGWWSVTVACKDMPIMFSREEAAEELPFQTYYYNAAVHRTSLASPEFLRRILMA